jgi:hypothetical protein
MNKCGLVLGLVAVASAMPPQEQRMEYQERLMKDIFHDYDKDIIPQVNASSPVDLSLGVNAFTMDMTDQGALDTVLWVTMQWKDARLAWDPKEYHDLQEIRVPGPKLWTPDIELYNAINNGPESYASTIRAANTNAIVYASGTVLWIPPVNARVLCNDKEFANWPWGEYDCSIKMGSWTFSSLQLNLSKFGDKNFIGTEEYGSDTSPVFFTKNSFAEETLKSKKYDCCPELYQSMQYSFKVQRKFRMSAQGKEFNPNELEAAFEGQLW